MPGPQVSVLITKKQCLFHPGKHFRSFETRPRNSVGSVFSGGQAVRSQVYTAFEVSRSCHFKPIISLLKAKKPKTVSRGRHGGTPAQSTAGDASSSVPVQVPGAPLPIQLPAKAPGKAAAAWVPEPLPPSWKTQVKFSTLDFCLIHSWMLWAVEEQTNKWESTIFPFFSHALPFK